MSDRAGSDRLLWEHTVARLGDELRAIPAQQRAWIVERLDRMRRLQTELHALFLAAGGAAACRSCRGRCCERGRNHLTLANLLAYLCRQEPPPVPDFAATCPFLGPQGCRLDVGRRPFNCVTFLCDALEDNLAAADRAAFYALEKELRAVYEAFAGRFAGAGLRGLLLRAERLRERALLGPPA